MTDGQDQPTLPGGGGPARGGAAPHAQAIGPYRLLHRIGEGGMGEVFLAQQEEPIRREVALKLIKPGMDRQQVLARFDAERQALALMDHPAIAKVLDAGATAEGRPYFVMEYVPGVAITTYCDLHKLAIRERLQLFIRVCEGVQHAHQKALIHRDLKPSNILVYEQDGRPVPKIIDFGVAKATEQELSERTMLTEFGQLVGTPEYMSPEQAAGDPDNIDTRTDIYSLGVILYELLIGVLPFASEELRRAGLLEIQRRICQDEPLRPSERFHTLGHTTGDQAASRSVEPVRLYGLIRGDLDWITMKALEKDRSRRYETANGLAMDVARYLNDEPVLATPPSTAYRIEKFVRRHRGAVVAATAILLISIGAAILSTTLYVRAQREAARARVQAARSDQVAAFMKSMLQGAGPSVARGRDTGLLREILDKTSKRLGTQLRHQPDLRAEMLAVLGTTYREIGEYPTAELHLREVLDLERAAHGERHPKALEAASAFGQLYFHLGRFEVADSILTWTSATQAEVLGANDPATLTTLSHRVGVLAYMGRFDEAAALGERILTPLIEATGDTSEVVLATMYTMAQTYADQDQYARAESLYTELLSVYDRIDDSDPRILPIQVAYGWMLRLASRQPEAEAMTKAALAEMRNVYGSDHSETQIAVNNLGIILNDQGKVAESEPYYRESLEFGIRTLGEKHPETVVSMINVGTFYFKNGRYAEGEAILNRSVAILTQTMPPDHIGTGIALSVRGDCRSKMGREAEAHDDYLAAFAILSQHHDLSQPRVQRLVKNIADSYTARGDAAHTAEWRAKLVAAPE